VTDRLLTRELGEQLGLTLTQLAERRRRMSPELARLLIEPFVDAGIVEERDGLLVVADPLVLEAFAQMEELPP
jgi:hypothetical protein